MTRDFEMAIAIKPKVNGNRYSQPVLETGYMPVQQAIDQANDIINKKFGTNETIEIHRQHRRRRD